MSINILVASGSATDRLMMQEALGEYNLLTASGGQEALRQLEKHDDIHLLILDLDMPGGSRVLEVLGAEKRYKKMRTIILAGRQGAVNGIGGIEPGAADFIRKPLQKESLRARVAIQAELVRTRRELEEKLQQSATFNTMIEKAPIGIAIFHGDDPFGKGSHYLNINPMFEKIVGRTKEEIARLGWTAITHPDDLEEDIRNYKRMLAGEIDSYSMEKRYIRPDGSVAWVYMVLSPFNSSEYKYNHICLALDITRSKNIEQALVESERSKSVLLSHLPGLAYRCQYDPEWTMLYVSDGCLALTGYPPESLLHNRDLSFNDLIAPEYRELLWKEWENALARREPFKYEYQIITADGSRKWVLEMGQGIFNQKGEVEALEGIILDISERKEMEDHLRYMNEHDSWTGLYNRSYLEKLLKEDARERTATKRAVVGINLSSLEALHAAYGFQYTQDLMKKTADTLKQFCTDTCLLFHTFEKKFVFYLKDVKGRDELGNFCNNIARRLESLLAVERIGGGIGVVEIDGEKECEVDELLKKLLIASEKAIDLYGNDFSVCFYDKEIEEQVNREREIKEELGRIARDESDGLFLRFQPVLDLRSDQVCGFEALARLKSEKLGLVSPTEFIPIAEKTKLIIPIGHKVIRQSLSFLRKLNRLGYDSINVSINVSVIQLLKNDFCDCVFKLIDEMQVNPGNITLELTESVFASNYEEINRIIGVLKAAGINIAIDDFGTGYSSLARERELNINCLKIDKYFIDNLMVLNPDKAITGDIVSMAHKFNHSVVAEGVEYEVQKQYLLECGCDKIQGYLVSKPLDEDKAIEFLEEYKRNKVAAKR